MSLPRARVAAVAVLGILLCTASALVGVPGTSGALTPRITNTLNTAASGIYATCTQTARDAGAYWAFPFAETGAPTEATDVSGNRRPGRYAGPIGFGAADGPCPRDGSPAIALNGSAWVTGAAVADPQTFTLSLWLRTATTTGGHLIGLGNPSDQPVPRDRLMYMANNGRIAFGVHNAGYQALPTPVGTVYNDKAWHHVVATLAPSGSAVSGMRLYVDGVQVNSRGTVTSSDVVNTTTSWRVGGDDLTGWPSRPSTDFFSGSVSYASVYTVALSAAQIKGLYDAGR